MGRLSSTDILNAIKIAKTLGYLGGGFYGQPTLRAITGASYHPIGYGGAGNTGFTTTATRVYYFPLIPIEIGRSYAGAQVYNSGVGDNGKKIRLMAFNDDATAGGPGTLEKDWGEITLTAASAVRTLSSAWTPTKPKYWGAVWTESACDLYGMSTFVFSSNVGAPAGTLGLVNLIGNIGGTSVAALNGSQVHGHYVDTTYGSAPSTAVAPTATIAGVPSATAIFPLFELKA